MTNNPTPSPITLHQHSKHTTPKEQNIIIEHRRFKRINFEILADIAPKAYFPNDPTPYQVLNVSFTGLFIKDQINYKKREILDIEPDIPAIGRIPMSICIVRINSSQPKGCGVEIIEIPQEYKKIWARFIKTCHFFIESLTESLTEIEELYQELQNKLNKE
jgi:hypothetical protein